MEMAEIIVGTIILKYNLSKLTDKSAYQTIEQTLYNFKLDSFQFGNLYYKKYSNLEEVIYL